MIAKSRYTSRTVSGVACLISERIRPHIMGKQELKAFSVTSSFSERSLICSCNNAFSFISSVEFKWQKPITGKGIRRRLKYTPLSQVHHYAGRLVRDQFNKRVLRRKYLSLWGPRYKGMEQDLKTHDLLTVIARPLKSSSRFSLAVILM